MRRGMCAVGVVVAGLGLAGCGDGGNEQTITIGEGKGGGGELFSAMAEAQDDAGSYLLEMVMDAGPQRIEMNGAARSDGDSVDMRLTMAVPMVGDMEMLFVDDIVYMDASALGLPGDSPWLSIDPSSDDELAQQFGVMDPANSVDLQAYFTENSDEITVEEGGADTIDGVDVTEYIVTVDMSAIGELPNAPEGIAVDELALDEVSYSMWVDGDLLLRQITSDLSGFGSMEARFFDYGEPVEIEAPDPDEVEDFSSILGDLPGG